jgi:hypothetical protein
MSRPRSCGQIVLSILCWRPLIALINAFTIFE